MEWSNEQLTHKKYYWAYDDKIVTKKTCVLQFKVRYLTFPVDCP